MTTEERDIIRAYSLGDISLRIDAISIYRFEVIEGRTGGPEMRFMEEIDTQMHDYLARARARERLHDVIAQERRAAHVQPGATGKGNQNLPDAGSSQT